MRAILRAAVVASIVSAGCSESVEPPIPPFSANPTTQWSGGSITLRSSFFVGRDPLPVISAGNDTLPLTRQDDSTVATKLPRGPTGSVTLAMQTGPRSYALATVQRVGFRELRISTVPMDGELLATDSAGVPFVLGGFFNGSGNREPVVRLRLTSGQAQAIGALREPSNAVYGIAPTSTSGVFAVRDASDSVRLARLLDDAPAIVGTVPWVGTEFTRQVSLLGGGKWLFTGAHSSWTRRESDSAEVARIQAESPWSIYLSPRGDRSTIAVSSASDGVPVFDNATGAIAYRLPLVSTEAAVFSPDGATLYAAGASQFSSDTLVAVDASTGSIIGSKVTLPDGFDAMGMAYRNSGEGQLLIGAANSSSFALLVYRASTLELLGILPSGDSCGANAGTGSACFMGIVTVDNANDAAYMVIPGSPTPIWTFDLVGTP